MFSLTVPGTFEWIHYRTRWYDDQLLALIMQNDDINQMVVLGAGFDTRGFDLSERLLERKGGLEPIQVFEIDLEEIQKEKKRVAALSLSPSDSQHLSFVAADFRSLSLEDALVSAGFDPSQPSIFLMEAVSCYLEPQHVDSVLENVARLSRSSSLSSHLLMDVIDGTQLLAGFDPSSIYGGEVVSHVASKGEPMLFGLEREKIPAFFTQRGLRVERVISAKEMKERDDQSYLGIGRPWEGVFAVHLSLSPSPSPSSSE